MFLRLNLCEYVSEQTSLPQTTQDDSGQSLSCENLSDARVEKSRAVDLQVLSAADDGGVNQPGQA